MAAKLRTPGGLAARIVRVTLLIGAITVTTAGAVALVSTSRLSVEKAEGRDVLAVQFIEDRTESELRDLEGYLADVAFQMAQESSPQKMTSRFTMMLARKRGSLDAAYLVRPDGSVVASMPGAAPISSIASEPVFSDIAHGRTGYIAHAGTGSKSRSDLWFVRTLVSSAGRPVILVAKVDTGFLGGIVREVSAQLSGRTVAVLDRGSIIANSGASSPQLSRARWTPVTAGSGRVTVPSVDGTPLGGQYNDIQGLDGIDWRIMVVEPAQVAMRDTMRAVTPAVMVLIFGGVVAIAAAWGVSQRLVRPLRDLEGAARSAAAGSYVKPLPVGRADEIGAVSEAFNDLALRLNALHDLSQLLASASQVDQVLDGILSAMGHIVGPGGAAIYLVEGDGSLLTPVRTRGIDLAAAEPVKVDVGGWLARALYSSSPVDLIGSPAEFSAELPGLAGSHSSALAAPLLAGHEALGVVVVLRDAGQEASEAEREMVRTFSAQAAVAVQTSRLFEEESASRQVAEALRAVAEELVRPDGLGKALGVVEWIIRDVLSAPFASILLVDRAALGLPDDPARGRDPEFLAAGLRVLSRGDGNPVVHMLGDGPEGDRLLVEFDAAELLVVPVGLDTDHGAVMMIALSAADHTGKSLRIASALADELELALDNAFFYERALTRAANLETIFRISQAVGSSLQVNVVLNRVLDVVQKILSADSVALLLHDSRKGSLATSMARGAVPPSVLYLEVKPGEDLPGHVFKTGQPVSVRDLHASMDGLAGSAASHDLRSLLAVPLMARGRPIGVLMVFSVRPGAFADEDLNMLQTFATQAALAIDTASLYSREHDVAQTLQRSILPGALPEFAEIRAAAEYRPAGGDAEIGGDYYDLFRAPDGAIWFTIADVCGKGVRAATKTSMIKYSARALVSAGLGPAEAMSQLNRFVGESGDASDIVTSWLGRLDPHSGELAWADGGHPPAVLRRADGTIERLGVTGPLLGAAIDAAYAEKSVRLGEGDAVLLYTDGVTEGRFEGEFFGEERVDQVFGASIRAIDAPADLLRAVQSFVRVGLKDDVAVLVVEIAGTIVKTHDGPHEGFGT